MQKPGQCTIRQVEYTAWASAANLTVGRTGEGDGCDRAKHREKDDPADLHEEHAHRTVLHAHRTVLKLKSIY